MTTTRTLRWIDQIKLPDGHRIFRAPEPFHEMMRIHLPSSIQRAPGGGIWALADNSGSYPEQTDDGVLWLDFSRDLNAGRSATDDFDGTTPMIPLIDSGNAQSRTITDTCTLLWLSTRFDWRIRCGNKTLGVIER